MKNEFYRVRIYPAAQKDMQEMKNYYNSKLKISAQLLFSEVNEIVSRLESNPLIFPLSKDRYLRNKGYRIAPVKNCLLFYVIRNDEVQIRRFLYSRRNYQELL